MTKRPRASRTTLAVVLTLALTGTLATVAVATSDDDPKSPSGTGPAVATATDPVTHEDNDRVPKGARWTQHYFPSSDGSKTDLHADVLLPEDLPAGEKVPVILSAGAYFGHSGETGDENHESPGPAERFRDFVEGAGLLKRGYAFVMVDTRGFGGSSGCYDYGGRGDTADVKAAIEWSSKQPWSSGAVGMYGKSFDAWTGLLGNNTGHPALKAVVAQEPIWDLYKHSHNNGIPRFNGVTAPTSYDQIAKLPPLPGDDKRYRKNAAYEKNHPECAAVMASANVVDPDDPFWTQRSAANGAKGTDTPLLFTQGLTETNTKPLGMEEFLANHRGVERGWIGPWDHVRGDERGPDGKLAMGREGWFGETLSFFDEHLKDLAPQERLPNYAVQDNTGVWRAEKAWPATDRTATLDLGGGTYTDSGAGTAQDTDARGPEEPGAPRFLIGSKPLERDTRVSGTPRVSMSAEGEGNVMVKLYDVAPDGTAVAFDEQVSRLDQDVVDLDLKSTDWTLPAGHRLTVQIGSVLTGEWIDTPSKQKVSIRNVKLELPLDDPADDTATEGARAPFLDQYMKVNAAKLGAGPARFTVPSVSGKD
ncbi:CocE/NonD family hydrolase [Streptomyces parvulus]|uniref:CocE/NonD family hydrolase n=1 Tax=Streptomyces parvulus TaxID=146923 RepID=UPI003425ED3B